MNAQTKIVASESATGLALLRQPFPPHHISKLPKPTRQQTDAVKADFKQGIRCEICGTWHHPKVAHLDYVGHAALTDRLLDADPEWTWEPVAFTAEGLPAQDKTGGLWIRMTVAGVTRLGYGSADGKSGGDAIKEIIGDALRNAAMRFGAALDLWHKGDLHLEDEPQPEPATKLIGEPLASDADRATILTLAQAAGVELRTICESYGIPSLKELPARKVPKLIDRLKADAAERGKVAEPAEPDMAEILADDVPF